MRKRGNKKIIGKKFRGESLGTSNLEVFFLRFETLEKFKIKNKYAYLINNDSIKFL